MAKPPIISIYQRLVTRKAQYFKSIRGSGSDRRGSINASEQDENILNSVQNSCMLRQSVRTTWFLKEKQE
jgi:hypothetical protein